MAEESLAGLISFFRAGRFPARSASLAVETFPDCGTGLDRFGNQCKSSGLCPFKAQIDSIRVAAPVGFNALTPVPLPSCLPLMLAGLARLTLLRCRA
jgi:hypothetical protein